MTKTSRLPASHESTVYTYNGIPLQGLGANDRFVITAVAADVRLPSMYTGRVASTADFGDIAYEYNGQVFGFCSSHADAVRRLLMGGYRVEVEAYISGFDETYGYPKVRGLFGFVDDDVLADA